MKHSDLVRSMAFCNIQICQGSFAQQWSCPATHACLHFGANQRLINMCFSIWGLNCNSLQNIAFQGNRNGGTENNLPVKHLCQLTTFHNYSSEIIMLLVLARITLEHSFLQQIFSSNHQYISSTVWISLHWRMGVTVGLLFVFVKQIHDTFTPFFSSGYYIKVSLFIGGDNGFAQLHRRARSNEMLYNDVKIKAHHNL